MGVIKRQGIKNTVSTYLGIVLGFVNLLIVQPYFLTKEEIGLTRILYSFSLVIAVFVPLGIGNVTTRYFPLFKDETNRHHGYLGFMLLFPVAGYFLSAFLIWLFRDFIIAQYITESPLFTEFFNYVFPMIFFVSLISVLNVYCFSNFKSTIPSYLNDIGIRLMTIVVVSMYYLKWINLDEFIACFTGIYGIQLLFLASYILYFDRPGLKINWPVFRERNFYKLIRYGMLLWFAGVASIGLKYFDSLMLGKYMALSFVGIYSVVAFIPTVIEAPLNAFERIASPKIAFAWNANDMNQIREIYNKSSLYMFMLGGFLFLNINLNITDLLTFLPAGFEQGIPVVYILSISTLFNMATGLNAAILFNSDQYRYGALFLVLLAGFAIALQMVFIPIYGLTGAALATATASLLYNSMLLFYVYKKFRLQPFATSNLKIALLVLLVCILFLFLPDIENKYLNIIYHSIIASSIYFIAVYKMNIVPELHTYLPWEKK